MVITAKRQISVLTVLVKTMRSAQTCQITSTCVLVDMDFMAMTVKAITHVWKHIAGIVVNARTYLLQHIRYIVFLYNWI